MPKGKPWPVKEERQLRALREEGKTVAEIAERMNKTAGAIKQKLRRCGLKVVTIKNSGDTTTSELILPEELPSVEDALKKLAAAMNALETPGLSKNEIMRLRSISQISEKYQKLLANYVDYRGIERKVDQAIEKLQQRVERQEK
jgi:hypothetical protein